MNSKDNYIFPKKSDLEKINIKDINCELPDLKFCEESKSIVIGKWLVNWIVSDLKAGKIHVNNIIPAKSEFAYLLGVSVGTIQNAFRYIEDLGYVESKQCIGTMVRDYNKEAASVRKLTSKRDLAVEAIKRYIATGGFKVGAQLPSSRTVATIIGFSVNTTRLALETLATQNIVCHRFKNARDCGWSVLTMSFDVKSSQVDSKSSKTLVDMVVKDLEDYITENLKVGDRIPAHDELSKSLKASLKTVHDGLKVLIDRGGKKSD